MRVGWWHVALAAATGYVCAAGVALAAPIPVPAAAPTAQETSPCGTAPPSTAPYRHIVVLMDENMSVPEWQSNPDLPYMHLLAADCRMLSNAAGETHPSFPNYLAVASGAFPRPACLGCFTPADNIYHQLDVAGMNWRVFNQSMPANCAPDTGSAPTYRAPHNSAYWFTDLRFDGRGSCGADDVPLDPNLDDRIPADELPYFSWIVPDFCYDMHWLAPCDAETGQSQADRMRVGDQFVQHIVQEIASMPSYQEGQTLIVLTWDESNYHSIQAKGNWGIDCSNPSVYAANTETCQVVTILISARLPAGADGRFYSHYSIARAIEQNFGLPYLGGAASAATAPIY